MMNALLRFFRSAASLRLTIICLSAAIVLVFAGTLAQVKMGLYLVQEEYFQSWIVWWTSPSGNFRIPAFPGGHLIGAVLLVNLIASLIQRFSLSRGKIGIQFIHIGIIIMLAGALATDLFSVNSYMRIKEGETKNYSEDSMRMELAIIDHNDSETDQVIAIPGERLAQGGTIDHEALPFRLIIRGFYRNSKLQMLSAQGAASVPAATMGTGQRVAVTSAPRATRLNERDIMSAVIEVVPENGESLGTWLVSDALAAAQDIGIDGRRWSVQIRPTRYYKPYSLTLREFTHETYPGTSIPKNFSSSVDLIDPENNESRPVLIYMNNPLRYLGDTYYQSGYEPDNTGSILQVVRNPSYQAPYIACLVVSLGLIYQFTLHLTGFARRSRPPSAP
jgi:hypothetical protein